MFRSAESFLALRYLRPQKTFVSTITVLSILGVSLGVWALIVVLSVMRGFEKEMRVKVLEFNPHVIISQNGDPLIPDAILEILRKDPAVVAATPYVNGPVLVECASRVSTPIIRGVDPETSNQVIPINQHLSSGEFELRGDSVLVGQEWARRHGAVVGDKILVYSPGNLGDWKKKTDKAAFLPSEMTITGIFYTGMHDYDLNFMITSIFNAQRFYRIENRVHGIQVRLQDPFLAQPFKLEWNTHHGLAANATTWMDQNRPLFRAIATEQVMMALILLVIMLVAAFGLCSTLITITVQKRREIGILKALGARDAMVLRIFLFHGAWVGLLGSGIGLLISQLTLSNLNLIRDLLLKVFQIDAFSAAVYQLTKIPADQNLFITLSVALTAIAICILAALLPAWQAARLAPASALRNE